MVKIEIKYEIKYEIKFIMNFMVNFISYEHKSIVFVLWPVSLTK